MFVFCAIGFGAGLFAVCRVGCDFGISLDSFHPLCVLVGSLAIIGGYLYAFMVTLLAL